jgi:hypothetical protein
MRPPPAKAQQDGRGGREVRLVYGVHTSGPGKLRQTFGLGSESLQNLEVSLRRSGPSGHRGSASPAGLLQYAVAVRYSCAAERSRELSVLVIPGKAACCLSLYHWVDFMPGSAGC